MRFLRAAIVSSLLIVTVFLVGDLFADQVYGFLERLRNWAGVLSTRNNYGFLADRDPFLRFNLDFLAPPVMLRKSRVTATYVDSEGYEVFKSWLMTVPTAPMVHPASAALIEPIDHCFSPKSAIRLRTR